jgi:hypothetical protein
MSKKDLTHLQDIPSIDRLEKQYYYISNVTLRKNISITVQYIIFLLHLEKAYNLPGVLEYNIFTERDLIEIFSTVNLLKNRIINYHL